MAISRSSLLTLEAYAKVRKANQVEVIAHRKLRTVRLGEHLSVQFEDETTIRRQIQEMLHIEKIFDEAGIESEIEAYAPLVPDGRVLVAESGISGQQDVKRFVSEGARVVLVGEGPAPRIGRLLEAERKRTARVISGVPITLIQAGDGEGQVPLRKLPRAVQRLKPTLTKQEVGEVLKRLTALGAVRLPVPKGIDPMRARPDRKGMRGR